MASKTEERRPSEAPVLNLELDNFSGEAASKAIQKMFPQLRQAVTKNEVPDYLFAEGVLTQSTFELSTNVGLSDSEKGRKYIIEIQHLVGYNPEKFETFCEVLEEHGHGTKDLIKKLRGKFKQQLFHNIAAMSVPTLGIDKEERDWQRKLKRRLLCRGCGLILKRCVLSPTVTP